MMNRAVFARPEIEINFKKIMFNNFNRNEPTGRRSNKKHKLFPSSFSVFAMPIDVLTRKLLIN